MAQTNQVNYWNNPGNVPPPSKPEDSNFCKMFYRMKVNITILSMYQN